MTSFKAKLTAVLASVALAVGTDGYLYIGRWSSNPGDIPLVIVMYGCEVDASMY